MATGNSNKGIADRLVITVRAVEKYVSSIFGKLDLPSSGTESRRVLAVLLFLQRLSRGGKPPPDTPETRPPERPAHRLVAAEPWRRG